eukprot:6487161-Pyramimonas_sp.AAC.1
MQLMQGAGQQHFRKHPPERHDAAKARLQVERRRLVVLRAEKRERVAELGSRDSDCTSDDEQLEAIKRFTKQLRQWARRRRAERRMSLESDLARAEKLGHTFEMHRIAPPLAERARGTRRR